MSISPTGYTPPIRTTHISDEAFDRCLKLVNDSGIVPLLAAYAAEDDPNAATSPLFNPVTDATAPTVRPARRGRPARKAQYNSLALLVLLTLCAEKRDAYTLANMLKTCLYELSPAQAASIGLASLVTETTLQELDGDATARPRRWATEYERLRESFDRILAPLETNPHPRRRKQLNRDISERNRRLTKEQRQKQARNRTRLLTACNRLIAASLPAREPHYRSGDVRLDGTFIESSACIDNGTGLRSDVYRGADPEAGWLTKGKPEDQAWGYELTLTKRAHRLEGREVANVCTGMSIGTGTGNTDEAMEALDFHVLAGQGRHGTSAVPLLFADRGYTNLTDFAARALNRGYALTPQLTATQRAAHALAEGPIIFHGVSLCPAAAALTELPYELPKPGASGAEVRDHATRTERLLDHLTPTKQRVKRSARTRPGRPAAQDIANEEALAAATPNPNDRTDGDFIAQISCPARAGLIRCPLVEASMRLDKPSVAQAPTRGSEPLVCRQQDTNIVLNPRIGSGRRNSLPLKNWSEFLESSYDWADIFNGNRSRCEAYHAMIGSRHGAGLNRDSYQMMGMTRTALLASVAIAITNQRSTRAFEATKRANGGQAPYEDRRAQRRAREQLIAEWQHNMPRSNTAA
jgi:hypothetical protein